MIIGKLRERILIQTKSTADAGSFGASNNTWSDVKTIYAQMQPLSESEGNESNQTVASTTLQFRIRKPMNYAVDATMRIVYDNRKYYITGIRPAPAGDHYILTAVHKDNE